ncbi:MAG: multiprotein-bridging factor 1 family protein [Bdellovibrionales bacterium]
MINAEQIRAARGLLDWSTADLAKQSGLTVNGINKIERGHVSAHRETLENIQKTFQDNGIEFLDNSGVRIKQQGVDILVGQKGLCQFFDGVYEHARDHGGTIVQFGVDEKQFLTHLGAEFSADYVKRMTNLSRDRKDLKVKAIICEGETDFLASDYNEYRWISKQIFQAVPFYICGETLAIMDFQTVPAPTIVLLKFSAITNAYRKQFDAFWEMASETPEILNKARSR